jgi:hypothetical protein
MWINGINISSSKSVTLSEFWVVIEWKAMGTWQSWNHYRCRDCWEDKLGFGCIERRSIFSQLIHLVLIGKPENESEG